MEWIMLRSKIKHRIRENHLSSLWSEYRNYFWCPVTAAVGRALNVTLIQSTGGRWPLLRLYEDHQWALLRCTILVSAAMALLTCHKLIAADVKLYLTGPSQRAFWSPLNLRTLSPSFGFGKTGSLIQVVMKNTALATIPGWRDRISMLFKEAFHQRHCFTTSKVAQFSSTCSSRSSTQQQPYLWPGLPPMVRWQAISLTALPTLGMHSIAWRSFV